MMESKVDLPQPEGPTIDVKTAAQYQDRYYHAGISLWVYYMQRKYLFLSDNRGGDELVGRAFINNPLGISIVIIIYAAGVEM